MAKVTFPSSNEVERIVKEMWTNTAAPTPFPDEPLPAIDGVTGDVRLRVIARSAADFRKWDRHALIGRTGGNWSVLGGGANVVDLTTPAPSAGASGWAVAPALPGGLDVARVTVTGALNVAIRWVMVLEVYLF